MSTSNKQKKLTIIFAVISVCIILALGSVIFFLLQNRTDDISGESFEIDNNITIGDMPGVDMEKRKEELQEELDDSMIAYSINTNPVFESGRAEGNLLLENPANNAKLLKVEIVLDKTNEKIYSSKAIPAGSYIENARLEKVLDEGVYVATAYFKAYHEEDHSYIGQVGAAIKINVLS